MTPRVWLITGTSAGLGAALAAAVYEAGDIVACAQRNVTRLPVPDDVERVLAVPCDLGDASALGEVVAAVLRQFGRIDVLVNNGGIALHGAVEEVTDDELREVFEINFFGAARLIGAVLPHMRERRGGHIINLSSIGGFVGMNGSGAYSASKFALEGLSELLAREMAPFNVKVTIVEPGAMRTDFRKRSLRYLARRVPAYDVIDQLAATVKANADSQRGDPTKAAGAILSAVRSEAPPLRLLLGPDAWAGAQAKLAALTKNFDDWQDTTIATDFDPEV